MENLSIAQALEYNKQFEKDISEITTFSDYDILIKWFPKWKQDQINNAIQRERQNPSMVRFFELLDRYKSDGKINEAEDSELFWLFNSLFTPYWINSEKKDRQTLIEQMNNVNDLIQSITTHQIGLDTFALEEEVIDWSQKFIWLCVKRLVTPCEFFDTDEDMYEDLSARLLEFMKK